MAKKSLNQMEIIASSWNVYSRHSPLLIMLLLISLIGVGIPTFLLRKVDPSQASHLYWFLRSVQIVAAPLISFVWIFVSLRLCLYDKVDVTNILGQLRTFPKFLATAILYLAIALGPAFVMLRVVRAARDYLLHGGGGFLANVHVAQAIFAITVGGALLGLYWAIQLSFAPYATLNENLGPLEAIKRSTRITRGVKIQLSILLLALFVINLLGILPLGLGLLITIPLTRLSLAYAYTNLSSQTDSAANP